jgi:hypothetical protein
MTVYQEIRNPIGLPPIAWVACMTDTHAYNGQTTDCLTRLCTWIAANRVAKNIVAVFHRGDFASVPAEAEWVKIAASGFPVAGIPNVWSTGNHDSNLVATRDYTDYNAAMPAAGMSGLAGVYAEGSSTNTWSLVDVGGRQWLVLALEFAPPDAVVTWADGVLAANPTIPAIVLTHSDLYHDGALTDPGASPSQNYVYTGLAGGNNYGQQLWTKSFLARGNVALVLSGHDILNACAYLGTARAAGAMFPTCHHVVRNYQSYNPQIVGNPFMTLIGFDYLNNWLYFEEFSPAGLMDMWLPSACMRVRMVG